MGRRKRNHVLKLAKERNQKRTLMSNQEAVKASTSDLNNKPMVEPTIEPKIALKAENEAPVEIKQTNTVAPKTQKPKTTTRKRTAKKPTTLGTKKKTTAKKTTTRRRKTTKKVEETNNEQS
jgi:hypothetical protein